MYLQISNIHKICLSVRHVSLTPKKFTTLITQYHLIYDVCNASLDLKQCLFVVISVMLGGFSERQFSEWLIVFVHTVHECIRCVAMCTMYNGTYVYILPAMVMGMDARHLTRELYVFVCIKCKQPRSFAYSMYCIAPEEITTPYFSSVTPLVA